MLYHFTCYQVAAIKHRGVTNVLFLFVYSCLCYAPCTQAVSRLYTQMNACICLDVCVSARECDLSTPPPLIHSSLPWQLTFTRCCLPSVKSNLSLVRLLIELGFQNTGVVPEEQTTWALKTTSGCLLIPLKASVLVQIWFTKGGQLGNRFCIELLWISSLWTNATFLHTDATGELSGYITLDCSVNRLNGK